MFDDIKDEMTRKICELRIWLSNVDDGDDYAAINKGLYYVYIYGIYEETVRMVVQRTIAELNSKFIKIDKCFLVSDKINEVFNLINNEDLSCVKKIIIKDNQ